MAYIPEVIISDADFASIGTTPGTTLGDTATGSTWAPPPTAKPTSPATMVKQTKATTEYVTPIKETTNTEAVSLDESHNF